MAEVQDLIMELKIRGFTDNTITAYTSHNQNFLKFIGKPPSEITTIDIKSYMAYLIADKKLKPASVSLHMSALRFFYDEMMEKGLFIKIKIPKQEKKIPQALTKDEIRSLLAAIENPKHKLLVELLYSSGLRVSECVNLKVKDLDIKEKIGKVISGKGRKDRFFILSEKVIVKLLTYIAKRQDSNPYLFNKEDSHIGVRNVQKFLKVAAMKAGITKNVFPHVMRSSFATHLLESGTDIRIIQELLGHSNLATTQRYTKVSTEQLKKVRSPLDDA